MSQSSARRNPVEELAEEFLRRYRQGERPSLSEYAARHPELADEIREVFPALAVLEEAGIGQPPNPGDELHGLSPPRRLDDYRIVRELRRGGMATVYEAVQESLSRRVALKVLPRGASQDPLRLARFRREAKAAARLHHTNIVPVFDVGESAGNFYYAMQFIQGQALDEVLCEVRRLRQAAAPPADGPAAPESCLGLAGALVSGQFALAGRFPAATEEIAAGEQECLEQAPGNAPSDARRTTGATLVDSPARPAADAAPAGAAGERPRDCSASDVSGLSTESNRQYYRSVARIGRQAAEALTYAHAQRILHRDIKPSNLLLDVRGTVWVADFGLVKDDGGDLTQTGDVVGTLRYMAPERFSGESDARGDLYSLGVTLYELLTLRPAFSGSDRLTLLARIEEEEPPAPRQLDPHLPRDLDTIVRKAMAKRPADRYASAAALAEDLQRFLDDRPILARRPRPWEQFGRWCRRNRGLAALTLSVWLLLAALTTLSQWSAARLTEERNATRNQLQHTRRAEALADRRLFESLLAQARQRRGGTESGRRVAALKTISEAVALSHHIEAAPTDLPALRNEAASALLLPDLVIGKSRPLPNGHAYDLSNNRYLDSNGQTLVIRGLDDGREIRKLRAAGRCSAFSFSPRGRYLAATQEQQGEIAGILWDLDGADDQPLLSSRLWGGRSRTFSDDDRRLAFALSDGGVALYDLPSGREFRRLPPGAALRGMAFDRRARRLAACDADGVLRIHDMEEATAADAWRLECASRVVAFSPDDRLLAAAGDDFRVYVYDLADHRLLSVLSGHEGRIVRLRFHGDSLLSASWDLTTRLWNPVDGHLLARANGTAESWSSDGLQMTVFEDGAPFHLGWLVEGAQCRRLHHGLHGNRSKRPEGWLLAADWSARGDWLAATAHDGLRLWHASSGRELAHLAVGVGATVKFRGDGQELLCLSSKGVWRWPIHDLGAGAARIGPPRCLQPGGVAIGCGSAYDPAGRRLLFAAAPTNEAVFVDYERADAPEPTAIKHFGPLDRIRHVSLSADGQWAAAGTWHGDRIRVWNTNSGKLVFETECHNGRPVFSPDGQWLATAEDVRFRLWRVGDWQPGPVLPAEPTQAWRLAFSPDGAVLAVGASANRRVKLIDAADGKELVAIDLPEGGKLLDLCFGPDGGELAIAIGYTLYLFDLRSVRRELAALGLDWPLPAYAAARSSEPPPAVVVVDYGDFPR